jgi:hypothetical protein
MGLIAEAGKRKLLVFKRLNALKGKKTSYSFNTMIS